MDLRICLVIFSLFMLYINRGFIKILKGYSSRQLFSEYTLKIGETTEEINEQADEKNEDELLPLLLLVR